MGFIVFYRQCWFDSRWVAVRGLVTDRPSEIQSDSWLKVGEDALVCQSGFPLAAVPQAGLSCDCLSVPAVQVRGCSAQQV